VDQTRTKRKRRSGKKALADFEAYNRAAGRSVGEDAVYHKEMNDITEASKALDGRPNNANPQVMLRLMEFTKSLSL